MIIEKKKEKPHKHNTSSETQILFESKIPVSKAKKTEMNNR